jgi:hypothetical protein
MFQTESAERSQDAQVASGLTSSLIPGILIVGGAWLSPFAMGTLLSVDPALLELLLLLSPGLPLVERPRPRPRPPPLPRPRPPPPRPPPRFGLEVLVFEDMMQTLHAKGTRMHY